MPIKVQLLLPDNLKSSYLRANFIESGSVYSTKKPSLNSAIDNNKHTLQFKFELTDNVTREPVDLNKVVSLKISNDPEFYSASTIELLNIPSAGSYSSTTNYTVNLNPDYFFGTSQTLETSRSTASGDGRFIINNWPLSASGGLSTVYMQAIVQSVSGEEGTYPEGYAIYDQIAWQGEMPTTPGRVKLLSNNDDWVGSQTLAHFTQASDSFSGINNTGVSNYIGDFIEYLETDLKSTRTTSTGNFRTLGAKYSASLLTLSANRVDYNGDNPTTGTGVSIASNITLNASSGRGALLTSATSTRTTSSPSYFTQAYVSVSLNTSTSEYRYIGRIIAGAENLTVKITSANNAAPVAILSRSGSAFTQSTTLPEHTRSLFLLGGLFEIFITKTSDSQLICSAYFTATDNQSYLLCDTLIPDFTTNILSSAFGVSINGADGTARIDEIAQTIGRSWLSSDLGDCDTEDYNPINFPVVKINNWTTAVNVDDDWIYYNSNITDIEKNPVYTSYLIFPKLDSSEIAELQCGKPTLSSRFKLDMSFTHTNNILYASFSTQHTQELNSQNNQRPMVSRTMPGYVPSTEPFNCSTVTVFFDALRREIYAVSRLFNNTVSTHVLARYTPDTVDNFSIEISDTNPVGSVGVTDTSVANGTWIILRKNNAFEGSVQLSNKLLPNDSGLGYYFALGCIANNFGNASTNTIIKDFAVYGLPELNRDEILDPVNIRHFLKSDTGTTNGKPWLGQYLLAGATDFDKWDYEVPSANGYEIAVQATTVGNNIINTATPSILDGYTVKSGDIILVKDQTDITENGLYIVINAGANGLWNKLAYGSPYLTGQKHQPINIINGSVNGGTLWYSDYPDGLVNSTSLIFKSTVFTKRIDFSSLSAFYSTINPTLMEIKALWLSRNLPAESFNIKFRFFADTSSTIGNAKTDWFELDLNPLLTTAISGAYNELLQKILVYSQSQTVPGLVFLDVPVENPNDQTNSGTRPLTISNNEKVWAAIRMPMGFKMASAVSKETTDPEVVSSGSYRGWNLAPRLWFKLFAKAVSRERNKTNNVIQQARTRAFTHAFISGSASSLSFPKKVDILAPADTNSVRPTISTVIDPSVRSAVVSILANDSQSGNLAFRVGKETDYGVVEYTPWQSWDQYNLGGTTKYSVYLYGTSKKNLLGAIDTTTSNLNAGMIGSRKVWVQVIDKVGNISESYPITLYAPGLSIVDTTPPSGVASFYNTATESKAEYTNKTWNWLKLDTQDRVTKVKDFRVRIITANGPGSWSSWNYLKEFNPVSFTGLQEGIRQLEVQFRDYGNNISPAQDFYSPLVSKDNLVFVSSTTWQKTSTNLESAYFGGVKQQVYTGLKLVPAVGSQYTSLTAFSLLDTSSGRTLSLRTVDNLTINGTATSYSIDPTSGLILFTSAVSNYGSVTVNVNRNSAVLFEWDNNTFSLIADLGNYNELCITSMVSYSGGLVIGTASGNIYLFDGKVVSGSYFTAQDVVRLPIACLRIHKFEHESNAYVYASTDKKPRLYRCLVDDLKTGSSWVRVGASGDLDLSSGGALSMVSSFNKLFIGCRGSKIVRYTRTSNKYAIETEILNTSILVSQNLGLNESTSSTIASLNVAPNAVIAGISERPEIWTYSEEYVNNPEIADLWTRINFDEMFVQDPAPAQYYFTDTTYKGTTTQRISEYIGKIGLYDEMTPGKKKDYLKLSSTSSGVSLYDFSLGSDWEQVINTNQPSILLDNPVKVATTNNITLSGLQTIDGILVSNNDRVLVKNQSSSSENGIYVASSSTWVRDTDFNASSNVIYKTGIYVTLGTNNSKTTWLLTSPGPYVFGTSSFIFEKPKYTIDIETQNISGVGKQGISISDSYWNYNVKYSSTGLYIDSGNNSKSVTFPNNSDSYFVSMSISDSQPNPNNQLVKAWTFASSGSNEDTGPYWGTGSVGTYDAWFAGTFVVPKTSGTVTNTAGVVLSESTNTEASFTTTNYYLRVETDITTKGNPKIVWQNTDLYSNNVSTFSVNTNKSIVVDNMCYIEIKLKTVYSSTLNTNNTSSKINLYYSNNSAQNKNYISQPIQNNEEYNVYRFRPSWNGIVNYIAFEFADFDTIPAYFDIDYIKIIKVNGYASITSSPSRIRIGVDGRDLTVWYGNNNEPLFYQKNFLDIKTSQKSLKFGKLDSEDGASEFIYGGLKFTVGNVYSPTKVNINDFHLTWRFSSTGGVKQIIHHLGSIYALTDGSISQRKSDNPDDRQMKSFRYDSGREVWTAENSVHAREIINSDLLGVIRPLTSVSHNGILLLCGQYGSIIE